MNPTKRDVSIIHSLYCSLTDQEGLPLRFDRQKWWFDWLKCGFTENDLKTVIRYLKNGIYHGRRNEGALKFSNLICDVERFEEDLFEAKRVLKMNKPRTPVAPSTPKDTEGVVTKNAVEASKIFQRFREQRR